MQKIYRYTSKNTSLKAQTYRHSLDFHHSESLYLMMNCNTGTVNCIDNEPCLVQCTGASDCANTNIHCPINSTPRVSYPMISGNPSFGFNNMQSTSPPIEIQDDSSEEHLTIAAEKMDRILQTLEAINDHVSSKRRIQISETLSQHIQQIMTTHEAKSTEQIRIITNKLQTLSDTMEGIDDALNNNEDIDIYSKAQFNTFYEDLHTEIIESRKENKITSEHLLRMHGDLQSLHHEMAQSRKENQSTSEQLLTMHSDVQSLHDQITQQNQATSQQLDTIHSDLHQYFKRKQNEEEKANDIHHWLQAINLGQYHHNFVSNGFETVQNVCSVNMFILEMIGISKIGHKIEILNACARERSKRNSNHSDSHVSNYYNDGNNCIQLSKIHKENTHKLENEYRDSIKQIIELNYSSNVNMHKFWNKGEVLREHVLTQFEQRRKKEKLKDKIVVETNSNSEYGPYYGPFIHSFIELNHGECASDPMINNAQRQSDGKHTPRTRSICIHSV
eukprot:993967_1